MSFPNYESFQGQPQGEPQSAAPAPQPQPGQPIDNAAAGFPAGSMGPGGAPPEQQSGEGKTTLW